MQIRLRVILFIGTIFDQLFAYLLALPIDETLNSRKTHERLTAIGLYVIRRNWRDVGLLMAHTHTCLQQYMQRER